MTPGKLSFWRLFPLTLPLLSVSCFSITPPSEINEKYRHVIEQRHNHYRLKERDQVRVSLDGGVAEVRQQEGLRILDDGRSDLFYMDHFKLGGKTLNEFEDEFRKRISEDLPGTRMRIQVTPAPEQVQVLGQFEKPGPIPLTPRMTVQDAVSAAGGMKITGDTDYALLRRPFLNPLHPDLIRIDLNDESEAIFLLPDDQIVLGRNFAAAAVAYIREYVFGWIPVGPLLFAAL